MYIDILVHCERAGSASAAEFLNQFLAFRSYTESELTLSTHKVQNSRTAPLSMAEQVGKYEIGRRLGEGHSGKAMAYRWSGRP